MCHRVDKLAKFDVHGVALTDVLKLYPNLRACDLAFLSSSSAAPRNHLKDNIHLAAHLVCPLALSGQTPLEHLHLEFKCVQVLVR